ncbi:MAG: hypothetical protein DRH06_00250 [Deltaproteobacteria bacterium]|nr:MAG: hypothetical protein DRH06_00250 [Deltaproteobacteria bacterium]
MPHKFPAKYQATWIGKQVYLCSIHLQKMGEIGRVLGVSVPYGQYYGSKPCMNCVNQANKEKEKSSE